MKRLPVWTTWLPMLILGCAGCLPALAESLLYVTDHERITFTNVPTEDARPIPNLAHEPAKPAGRSRLPETIYDPFIRKIAAENGLSPSLIKAVAMVESGFNTHAVSSKGAQGLMQLMPQTARMYGVRDAFDPFENLRAGAIHLRAQLNEFNGDLTLALAAYNAGAGAVKKYGGVPEYRETQEYVRRVHERMGRRAAPRTRSQAPPVPVRMRTLSDGSVLLSN